MALKILLLTPGQFKQISIAYQVLSDPELRHKYNEFGQKNGGGVEGQEGAFADPEEVFGKMFGGDRFEDLIGQISIGTSSSSCPHSSNSIHIEPTSLVRATELRGCSD